MTERTTYGINVCLTNGDIFCNEYATEAKARAVFAKLCVNPLVVCASLHDPDDATIATTDDVVEG